MSSAACIKASVGDLSFRLSSSFRVTSQKIPRLSGRRLTVVVWVLACSCFCLLCSPLGFTAFGAEKTDDKGERRVGTVNRNARVLS